MGPTGIGPFLVVDSTKPFAITDIAAGDDILLPRPDRVTSGPSSVVNDRCALAFQIGQPVAHGLDLRG